MPETATPSQDLSTSTENLSLLKPGSPVTIDLTTPAGQRGRFRSLFVGYLPKHYVLLQYPDTSKLGNFAQYITQGLGVTVRGLVEGNEGAVIAFVSNVKQTVQLPSRLIVLEFPRKVGLQNLRSNVRIESRIKSKVKIQKEYWMSIISDISISGCKLLVSNGEKLVLANNDEIDIVIEDFQGLENIKLSAQVCNSKIQHGGIMLGVKFSETSKADVTKVIQQTVMATR